MFFSLVESASMISALGVEESSTAPQKSKAELAPEVVAALRAKFAAGGVKLGISVAATGVLYWLNGTSKGLWASYYNLGKNMLEWSVQWQACAKGEKRPDGEGCFSPYREGQSLNWDDWIKYGEELSKNMDRTANFAWNNTPIMRLFDIIKNAPDRITEGFKPENWPWYVWAGVGVAGFAAFGSMLANAASIASSFRPRERERVNGINSRRTRRNRRS